MNKKNYQEYKADVVLKTYFDLFQYPSIKSIYDRYSDTERTRKQRSMRDLTHLHRAYVVDGEVYVYMTLKSTGNEVIKKFSPISIVSNEPFRMAVPNTEGFIIVSPDIYYKNDEKIRQQLANDSRVIAII